MYIQFGSIIVIFRDFTSNSLMPLPQQLFLIALAQRLHQFQFTAASVFGSPFTVLCFTKQYHRIYV